MRRHSISPIAAGLAAAAVALALILFAPHAHADVVTVEESPLVTQSPDTAFSYAADASDRAVAERVMDALANDPALEGSSITVLVDEGQVRLSGSARDEDQAAEAIEVARDAAGPSVAVSSQGLGLEAGTVAR